MMTRKMKMNRTRYLKAMIKLCREDLEFWKESVKFWFGVRHSHGGDPVEIDRITKNLGRSIRCCRRAKRDLLASLNDFVK